jgi:chlorobactene glucosyltransferase
VSPVTWLIASPWIAVLCVVVHRFVTRTPRLRDYEPLTSGHPPPRPLVSVIIPARNEARNIERCVRSVLATAYSPIEVIVVDDRSTDGTAEIIEPATGGRLRLVRGTDPPAGWFGKQWAIIQGYRVARGELLLFTDADTKHEPELLPRSVRGLQIERVDLFSVLPRQEMRTFWERLIQPHVFLALETRVGNVRSVNRTRIEWNGIANGQFILTTRTAYEAIGTHEAVKDTVADDLRLAQAYVRAKKDIFLAHAPEFMATRMYGSLREIIAGWSKNLALGAPLMTPPIRLLRAALPYLMWLPALFWIAPPVAWIATGWSAARLATLASLLTWFAMYIAAGAPVWYALLYPFGASIVAFIMIRSAWRGRRRVEWRGRVYDLSGSQPRM